MPEILVFVAEAYCGSESVDMFPIVFSTCFWSCAAFKSSSSLSTVLSSRLDALDGCWCCVAEHLVLARSLIGGIKYCIEDMISIIAGVSVLYADI